MSYWILKRTGATYHNLDEDCPCGDDSVIHDNTYGGTVRFGYDFNKYFGLEGRGIYTFGGDGFLQKIWVILEHT